MELIRGHHNLRDRHRGCVLAIGNFDGVHRGHQAVLAQLATASRRSGLPAVLMLFEPQPREYLDPLNAPARLTRLGEKLTALADTPLDRVVCLRFDRAFAALSPQQFIDRLLVARLGAAVVVVGEDFRFGHQGAGDLALLRDAGRGHGFSVLACERFELDGQRVSSSRVRRALADGDLETVERLLGRPYRLRGRVTAGDRIGRELGFPTANLPLHRARTPLSGVYAVRVAGPGDALLPGVANIGSRPTVAGTQLRLEVHLLDFDSDLYGRKLTVEFVRKLRDERRFDSLDALRRQIGLDTAAARACLIAGEV
jgi:riboflavin kinase/FMN adenylyltransferase